MNQLRLDNYGSPERFNHEHIEQQKANIEFQQMAPNITTNGRYGNKFQNSKTSINQIVNNNDTPQFKNTNVSNKSRRYQLNKMDSAHNHTQTI